MDPVVLSRVTRIRFDDVQLHSALLKDHKRVQVAKANYPAIFRSEGCKVEGIVVHGITPTIMARLDEFEDVGYERQTVFVELSNGRCVSAAAYVASPKMPLVEKPWDFQAWQLNHRENFLKRLNV